MKDVLSSMKSKKDCLRLFHLLFDQFFTHEECSNSVAFGKHGKVPEGKTILDKSKVNGILTSDPHHVLPHVFTFLTLRDHEYRNSCEPRDSPYKVQSPFYKDATRIQASRIQTTRMFSMFYNSEESISV
ncbi:hypothetical protein Q7C36_014775 [Tachysurus vachellii]|uniref:Uncharacterized protein n=1 Tax=Tachysurus vachellii TaxID=175792 RepID=A0AA88SEC7_TACVA|nr:hypothetical protein Q7C36_014775 [Tachysurus vachellii]